MKIYHHLLINQRVRSGFTLIELMMASMLTLVVVGAAGYGTVVMLRENTASSIASDTQYNLNRAADFITEEIKMANSVLTSFGTATGCNSGTQTPILGLNIAGQSAPVIYCIGTTTDPWLGKNMIYRWGPALNSDGSYGSWPTNPQPLVDLIAEAPQSSTCPTTPSAWTRIPSGTPKGFFVCIDPKNKMIELHLSASALDINTSKAQTTQWINPNTSSRLGDMATYEVVTQTNIRAPNLVTSPSTVPRSKDAIFTFSRFADISSSLTISISISGTAVAGTDYIAPVSTNIPFAPGSTTATLTIATKGTATPLDPLDDKTIIVTVTVTSAVAGGLGYPVGSTSSAMVTIQ
jgi:prepilin-type N-terminal cleavage/methylation domain-containing protein